MGCWQLVYIYFNTWCFPLLETLQVNEGILGRHFTPDCWREDNGAMGVSAVQCRAHRGVLSLLYRAVGTDHVP